jgi:sugar (pentulose or hexulose) kinase
MKVPTGVELGARGAAINAGVAVGLFADHSAAVGQMVRIEREYAPNAEQTARYDELYALYRELITAAWPIWERSWEIGIASW